MMRFICILLSVFVMYPIQSFSQNSSPAPGHYITQGGWGNLLIKRKPNGLSFEIFAVGTNAHLCELEGEIKINQSILGDKDEDGKSCTITFTSAAGLVKVEDNGACHGYCGMRANFDGSYLKTKIGCENAARKNTQNKFKQLYDQKKYNEALNALHPILKNCEKTLDSTEEGRIRNDLALTQYKLKNYTACLATLEPYIADADLTDEEVFNNPNSYYPPAEADWYLSILKAARTNIKLCRKGL